VAATIALIMGRTSILKMIAVKGLMEKEVGANGNPGVLAVKAVD